MLKTQEIKEVMVRLTTKDTIPENKTKELNQWMIGKARHNNKSSNKRLSNFLKMNIQKQEVK